MFGGHEKARPGIARERANVSLDNCRLPVTAAIRGRFGGLGVSQNHNKTVPGHFPAKYSRLHFANPCGVMPCSAAVFFSFPDTARKIGLFFYNYNVPEFVTIRGVLL